VRLELADLDTQPASTADCPVVSDHNIEISRTGGAGISLSATRLKVGPWGFVIKLGGSDQPVQDRILITQSRCSNSYQCWNFIDLSFASSGSGTLPSGSRVNVELTNDLVPNVVLEGLVFSGSAALSPEDAAQSRILLRHNTIISRGDSNYGIVVGATLNVPVTLANNVVAYISYPLGYNPPTNLTLFANWLSSDPSSKAWFENFDAGNFTPSANSPLVGAGDAAYGAPIDIDGHPRDGRYDIGAYQRQ
jgi:hypothetical protein